MWTSNRAYIDGAFVPLHGSEVVDSINPTSGQKIGSATLADREDARRAIAAAVRAQTWLAQTSKAERVEMLMALQTAMLAHADPIRQATIEEYGGPISRARWVSQYASRCFADAAKTLQAFPLSQQVGDATVTLQAAGVAALIAPWNSVAGTVCSKLAYALAAGCASVIKPSELSPLQTQVVAEALHDAGLPAGVFNILLGRGHDVGDELCIHPQIARLSFTGSTETGKVIARSAMATLKRVTLGLTGKSATILLDDAELDSAIPLAIDAAFLNNGQACVAGTRLLVPASRLTEIIPRIQQQVASLVVGDPADPLTRIGPLASQAQYARIQHFIERGLAQGAELIAGGPGRPDGLEAGFFVKPTVFARVSNDMEIAREEIFGPVLSVIAYRDEEEAVRLANDSPYGLQAYLFSADPQRAVNLAARIEAGTVLINRIAPDLLAPFGGVKQSGIGREFGEYGLASFLEAKSVVMDR